ncbi:MAG: hypothetical protein IH977_04020 [Nitrospinae bacterium]|nr:hypothetical protein [Nitrospinota bacterium]
MHHDVQKIKAAFSEAPISPPSNGEELNLMVTPKPHSRASSYATQIVDLASDFSLFHTSDGEAYATLPIGNHRETWRLASMVIRQELTRRFYSRDKNIPGRQATQDALEVLSAQAQFEGPEEAIHLRVAEKDGALYIDLANPAWEVVRVTSEGWDIVSDFPVLFRRSKGMLALPHPTRGKTLQALRQFINVRKDEDFLLLLSWLVGALNPFGPYPILVIHGGQGSGKSTAVEMLKALVDPNISPLRSNPSELRDLMISARNSWTLAFDNLSHLPPWLSDGFCRLSTGGGLATRQLYADDEEILFQAKRPILMNGIEELATRADLLDRAILLYLPDIPAKQRRPEKELWANFDEAKPTFLGAMFTALSMALREQAHVSLKELPRMADFALWITAAAPALDSTPQTFLDAYERNRLEANQLTLVASPIPGVLEKLLEPLGHWEGTATELLNAMSNFADDALRRLDDWPKSPQGLSNALRRLEPNLRQEGMVITFKHGTQRVITLENRCKRVSEASLASFDPPETGTQPLPPDDNDAPDAKIPVYSSGLGLPAPIKEVDI